MVLATVKHNLEDSNEEALCSSEISLKTEQVVFREDLYPRIKADPLTIQRYAENIEVLPAIEINQHNELIDGFHRWKAHIKQNFDSIRVTVTQTSSDAQFLALAIERNAKHGLQLSQDDKRKMATNIYAATQPQDRKEKKQELAKILSVAQRTLNSWFTDIDKQYRKERDEKILSMFLACYTQDDIAAAVDLTRSEVAGKIQVLSESADLPKPTIHAQNYELEDDSLPTFTVWSFGSKTNKVGHFGNSEQTIVDWLVYLYTSPLDIVVDPFAGGGATIDVCQQRRRRYWVGDRKPIVERENDIRQHDLVSEDGAIVLPDLTGRWKDVKLIYLDPPYWKQAQGEYSEDPTDFANMDENTFHATLIKLINSLASKAQNAYIALLMQPTQWNAPNRIFTDHVLAIAPKINRPVETRIQAPYQKGNCQPPMYKWAEENKKLLVLSREIIVWGPKQ